jgi:hypothetical protein
MIMVGTKILASSNDVDQFIINMLSAFFPNGRFSTIKQIFEWAKYPDLKVINVRDIMLIEKDSKRITGSVLLSLDYKQIGNSLIPLRGKRIDIICSYNELIQLCQDNRLRDFGIGCMTTSPYLGKIYATKLEITSKYLAYASIFISIWETKKVQQSKLLSDDTDIVMYDCQLPIAVLVDTKSCE